MKTTVDYYNELKNNAVSGYTTYIGNIGKIQFNKLKKMLQKRQKEIKLDYDLQIITLKQREEELKKLLLMCKSLQSAEIY